LLDWLLGFLLGGLLGGLLGDQFTAHDVGIQQADEFTERLVEQPPPGNDMYREVIHAR
jgi:hypothetical protein